MRWICVLALSAASAFGQLIPPNAEGVSLGHIHVIVNDPAKQIKVWKSVFGVEEAAAGPLVILKMPGIFIAVNKGEVNGGPLGSTVNHIAISVKNYAGIKAKLAANRIIPKETVPFHQMMATFPEGIRVEIIANKDLATPTAFHHVEYSVTDPAAERDWYVKTLGAEAATHKDNPAANIPGGQLQFVKASMPTAKTRGRTLDHIGFEVRNLEEFCKKLKEEGVMLDMDFQDLPRYKLKAEFLTDPAGTRIELTEGLADK